MQRRFVGADAGVTTDQVQLADRHIQRGLVGIFEMQKLLQRGGSVLVFVIAQVEVDKTLVAAYAMGAVHHGVADIQLGEILDQRFDIADLFLLAIAPARGGACREQLGFGDEIEAFVEPAETDAEAAVAIPIFSLLVWKSSSESNAGGLMLLARKSRAGFAPAITFRQDQHAMRGVAACAFKRASGSSAPRTTAISPSF